MSDDEPQRPDETHDDWRNDPTWRLVWYAGDFFSEADAPEAPTADAELAQPPIWASLYAASRIVAQWYRPSARRD